MQKPSRKSVYIMLQGLAFLLSAGIPIAVVIDKFPMLVEKTQTNGVGFGLVVTIVIAVVTFHKTIWATLKNLLGITSVPPLVGWAVALAILFGLSKLTAILLDLQVVCFAGLTGSALGLICSVVSQSIYSPLQNRNKNVTKEDNDHGDTGT